MSLVTCSECRSEISDKAAACPHCGAPVGRTVTTVEETGKRFKFQSMASVFTIITGFTLLFCLPQTDEPNVVAPMLILFGVLWYLVNRFRTWWNHS